jgi:hypothetical protein
MKKVLAVVMLVLLMSVLPAASVSADSFLFLPAITSGSETVTAAATEVDKVTVGVFQAAGDVGGGVLALGDTFPPVNVGHSILKRGDEWVQYTLNTSGLPPGAYTNWWVIFKNPGFCIDGCGEDDLFRADVEASAFWATGGVVNDNGIGNFVDRYTLGDYLGDPDTQHLFGDGTLDTKTAEIHIIVKYHGPASDDPGILYAQTHTVLGGCLANANAIDAGPPFGVQCFDPQAAAHLP